MPTQLPTQAEFEATLEPSPDLAVLARGIDSLRRRDPAQEARRAVARGDRRLLAVGGHSFGFPGVAYDSTVILRDRYGWQLLPHTGGVSVIIDGDSTHLAWQDAVIAYASVYNRTVLALVPPEP